MEKNHVHKRAIIMYKIQTKLKTEERSFFSQINALN